MVHWCFSWHTMNGSHRLQNGFHQKILLFPTDLYPNFYISLPTKSFLHFSTQQLLFGRFPCNPPWSKESSVDDWGINKHSWCCLITLQFLLVFQGLLTLFLIIILSSLDVVFFFHIFHDGDADVTIFICCLHYPPYSWFGYAQSIFYLSYR